MPSHVIKEKVLLTAKKSTKIKVNPKVSNSAHSLSQLKKTPRELAIDFQNELIKKTKDKYQSIKLYLVSQQH